MMIRGVALAAAMVLAWSGSAMSQPQTKLVSRLDKPMVQAIWCSSLFFERAYYDTDDAEAGLHYADLAFDVGDRVDALLRDEHGMRDVEIDEIWILFDEDAYNLAVESYESFFAQVARCERDFDSLL